MSPVAIKQLLFAIETISSVMRGKSVKPTVTPDSVHAGLPLHVTTINLGPWSPKSSVLPTRQLRGPRSGRCGEPRRFALAYLVLLRVEIARFTFGRVPQLALRPRPKLVSVALILTLCRALAGAGFGGQPLAATLPCAVRTFLQCFVSKIAPAVA
jgi:hypothetical protein